MKSNLFFPKISHSNAICRMNTAIDTISRGRTNSKPTGPVHSDKQISSFNRYQDGLFLIALCCICLGQVPLRGNKVMFKRV